MKRLLSVLLTCIFTLSMLTILSGCGDKVTQGLVFESNGDGTCTWTGLGDCTDSKIYVPSQNQTETVVAVGEKVLGENSAVSKVVLPDTIKIIKEDAFRDSTELVGIELGNGLEIIEAHAFSHCSKLASITFPGSLRSVGSYAFEYNDALTEVILPEGVTTVDAYAFSHSKNINKISIPASLNEFVSYNFDLTSLQELEFKGNMDFWYLSVDANFVTNDNKTDWPLISYGVIAQTDDPQYYALQEENQDAAVCAVLGKNKVTINGREVSVSDQPVPGRYILGEDKSNGHEESMLECTQTGEVVLLASGEQELGRAAYHFDASTDTYFASVPVQMDGETGTVSLNFKTYGEALAVSASYLSENAEVNRAGGVFILRQDTNQ